MVVAPSVRLSLGKRAHKMLDWMVANPSVVAKS